MTQLRLLHRRLRRAVLGRRRLLAAVLAALAVGASMRAVAPPPPQLAAVVTAARDLPSGIVVTEGDLDTVDLPPETVPEGAVTHAETVGRTTASPVRAGEALTDVRLVQASLLDGYPGMVAVPIRVGDAGAARLLRVGDRIDLVAVDPSTGAAVVAASDVPVVALPVADEDPLGDIDSSGALVVVAVTEQTARKVASGAVSGFISVVIRG
jgi:Flp pilus assembly protein CpaB